MNKLAVNLVGLKVALMKNIAIQPKTGAIVPNIVQLTVLFQIKYIVLVGLLHKVIVQELHPVQQCKTQVAHLMLKCIVQ